MTEDAPADDVEPRARWGGSGKEADRDDPARAGGVMNGEVLRVLVADDHAPFRRGVRSLLATVPGAEVVGEASDRENAIALADELAPDLVLMDLQMPGTGGLAAIRTLTQRSPEVNILVSTMIEDDESVFAAMQAGARGYVPKNLNSDDFARAIVTVGRGSALFSPSIAARMTLFLGDSGTLAPLVSHLTNSERSVLELMATYADNATIARRLSLSPKTVRNYSSAIFRKLRVADRAQAIAVARQAGLGRPVPPCPPS